MHHHPAMAPTPTRLQLNGEPRLVRPDGSAVLLERRAAALLALVALEPGLPRARAATWLWPDSAQARQALRQQLLRFRRLCPEPLVEGDELLQPGPLLQGALDGDATAGELLQGLAFDDCPEFQRWLDQQRQLRAGEARRRASEALAAAERAGDIDTALALAEQQAAAEPASEGLARTRMRLHYQRGDTAAALAVAAALRRHLRLHLGTEPGEALRELEQSLRTAQSAAAGAAPRPVAEAAPGPRELPLALLRPPRLVGRDPELARLAAAWHGRSAAVVVGEAGIGKTRLLDDLARQEAGASLRAAARPGDAGLPYALLTRLLRAALRVLTEPLPEAMARQLARLLPELGEPAGGGRAADQLRLFEAVQALLARAAAAGVEAVLLDDLHHADAASLEALRHAAATPCGLAWVASMRPQGGEPALKPLAETLLSLQSEVAPTQLELPPLARADVTALLASLPAPPSAGAGLPGSLSPGAVGPPAPAVDEAVDEAFAGALLERTGGHPLYLLETLKALWLAPAGRPAVDAAALLPRLAEMPALAGLFAQRLQRVSPRALALARCAAVAGQDFTAELAVAVLGQRAVELADAWSELEQARIFAGSGFAHDLVHEAAELTLPPPVAAALHAAVATQLEQPAGARPAPAARVAHHHERAGHPERAAPFWHAAGTAALSALRFAEAAAAFERAALGHGGAGRSDAAFDAAYAMRQACFELDLGERSQRALELLERYASHAPQRAQAANERAVTLLLRGDLDGCERAARAGLAALAAPSAPKGSPAVSALATTTAPAPAPPHPPATALLRAELRRNLAAVALWRQQTAAALAELRAVEDDVERLGSDAQRAEFRQSLAIVLDHEDQAEAAQAEHERAIALYLGAGLVPAAAQVAANLAASHHDTGNPAAAWVTLERARSLLATVPEAQRSYSSLSLNSGYVLTALGDYTRALDHLDDAVASARSQTPGWLPLVLAWRALLWLHLGQHARAQQDLAEGEPTAQSPPMAHARWTSVQAQLAQVLHGRHAPALAALDALLARQPAGGRRLSRWRLQLARLPHLGDDEAIAAAHTLQAELQGRGRAGLDIVVAAELAERLHRRGAPGDAAAALDAARQALRALATRAPDSHYRGRVWAQCLPVLHQADPAAHREHLAQALAWTARTAAESVPEPFRDTFRHRHPAHQALQRLASA
jgi:DNA-binding SARP family transcriptional activator